MADKPRDFDRFDFNAEEWEVATRIAPLPRCPAPETLRALGQQILPEDLERAVQSHVDGCALCRILRADLDALSQPGLSSAEQARIRTAIPGAKPARKLIWPPFAAAAALLLVAVAVFFVSKPHPNTTATTTPSAAPASSQPIAPPLQVAKLEPPALEPELIFRGATESTRPGANDLAPALAAYKKNDYAAAAQKFASLARRFPKSDIPPLYQGVSLLLAGNDSEAIASLAQAEKLAHGPRRDTVAWYYAVAADHLHQPDAPALFDALCKRNGSSYAHQACAALASRANH